MERDLQQLQIDARRQLTQTVAGRPREAQKLTLIEARRQRCRQARYERYLAVVELHRHVRRWDDWTNFAQKLIEAILPIQPAVYWIGHRMSIEREMACDDWVVATTGTAKPYAASLTKVAELSMGARGRAGSRRDRKTFATFQPRPSHAGQNSERGSEACPRPAGDGDCRSRDIDLRGRAGAANDRLRAESGVRK
jgi:hypothetical protein